MPTGVLAVWLCAYPEERDALIWPSYPLLISEVLHDTKKVSALRLHAARGTRGPFWQRQFGDRFVRHAREFRERLDYGHMNPVGKGLVKRPQDCPVPTRSREGGSSYNNFSLNKATMAACPIQIDDVRLPQGYRGISIS